MSVPGIPINPEEEKKKGAQTGNNPGESAVADGSRQPWESVNASGQQVVQTPQYDLSGNRRAMNQAIQEAHQSREQDPSKVTVKKRSTADYTPPEFKQTPYNQEEAVKRMEGSDWLKALNQQVSDANEAARKKAEASSRYAKAAAWGNFFSALGQLAGGGKNTYVKPERKYLTDALSKADKARETYDAILASNEEGIKKAKQQYLEADKEAHMHSQEQARKAWEYLVKEGYADAGRNYVEETVVHDPNAGTAADTAYLNAQTANIKAKKAGTGTTPNSNPKPPFFTPEFGGVKYQGDRKTAGKFVEIMTEVLEDANDVEFAGGDPDIDTNLDRAKLAEMLDAALKDEVKFDMISRKFIKKYGTNPKVKEFIEKLEKLSKDER